MSRSERSKQVSFAAVGSIAAIVISAVAVFIAWDEAQIMRRQQHASVTPIVRITTSFVIQEDRQVIAITAENVGIGPAFIEGALVKNSSGEEITMEEALGALPEGLVRPSLWTSDPDGLVMEAGGEAPLFVATWPADESINNAVRQYWAGFADSVDVSACFCSIYNRCWTTTLNQKLRPERVDKCVNSNASADK